VVGLDPASVPWWLLIAGVALIPVVFAIAMFLGLRRNALEQALIFVVGLSIVACGSLVIIAVEAALRPSF
jgi:Kef-type K+ transport system membrane component KefB